MLLKLKPVAEGVNTPPSSCPITAAQAAGKGDLPGLMQQAHWAADRDISSDPVPREFLQSTEFDPGLVDSGLLFGAETCGRNLEDTGIFGAFGAPFYIVRGTDQRFWGQDRLEVLDRSLAGA